MPIETVRLDANTYCFEDGTVRFFLLTGSERALLLDSGKNAPEARALAQALTDLPLSLMNTHADPDHISGNAAFPTCRMHPAEEPNYRAHGGSGELIPVQEGEVFDLGGRPLEVIHLPGHTPGSIVLLDRRARILYSGDSVQDSVIYMFGFRRDCAAYVNSLQRLNTMTDRFDSIRPCHGSREVSHALIAKLTCGMQSILAGEAEGSPVTLFGKDILLYRFPYAGFYCDCKA